MFPFVINTAQKLIIISNEIILVVKYIIHINNCSEEIMAYKAEDISLLYSVYYSKISDVITEINLLFIAIKCLVVLFSQLLVLFFEVVFIFKF